MIDFMLHNPDLIYIWAMTIIAIIVGIAYDHAMKMKPKDFHQKK